MIPRWEKAWRYSGHPFLLFTLTTAVLIFFGCAKRPPKTLLDGSLSGPMTASLVTDSDSTGILDPVVVVSVPQSALVYKKHGDTIEAGLEVFVSAYSAGQLIGGGVASQKVTLAHWDAAVTDSLLMVHVPLQLSSAKTAVLQVRVRSLNSSRFWERQLSYHAMPWKHIPLSLESFNWNMGSAPFLNQRDDSLVVQLLVKENILHPKQLSSVRCGQCWVVLEVSKPDGSCSSYFEQCVPSGSARDSLLLLFTVPTDEIPFGDVKITPLLLDQPKALPCTSPWQNEHSFTNLHINFAQTELWESHLTWLEGKAHASDLAELAAGNVKDRGLRWDHFWAVNGPLYVESGQEHTKQDHLLLIVEANKRFSSHGPGADSDRGRALIRYGIPSEVNKVGDSTQRTERWETWIYAPSQLKLVFQDPHGLGDFMLVDKTAPLPSSP